MKISKFEKAVLAITVAAVIFCAGFITGSRFGRKTVLVTTRAAAASETGSDEITEGYEIPAETDNSEEAEVTLVNINTASKAELETLPGIGEALASAIIDYREKHGAFTSVSELLNIYGIGESKLDSIAEFITV